MPPWALRIAVLSGVYLAVMLAAALWLPHEWDWAVFGWLSAHNAPAFSEQVSIVDVPWNPSDVAANRRHIAALLDRIVAGPQRPAAVILDVEFDPCQTTPCGEPMESARAALVRSITAATKSFPVFATEELSVTRADEPSGPVDPHDAEIYAALTGSAHTRFTTVPHSDGIFYRACYPNVPLVDRAGRVQGTENVWAMVDRVLMPSAFVTRARCDSSHLPIRLGPRIALRAGVPFDDRYVIIGTTEYDRSPFTDRSGPELLGWALSNALDRATPIGARTYYDTRPQNGMLLVVVPAFSALAVVIFTASFLVLKRMRLRAQRRFLPWITAALATGVGIAAFVAFEAWMLEQHQIQPQVTLISLGILLAATLSGYHGSQVLRDEANTIDVVPAESYDYDVFISYAHDEGAWVFENVYVPFRDATLPDGRKLSVFFDTTTIRSGTAWQTKLAMAIDASRFIVPVYSEVYFTKPYCRFEILRAHRKWIAAGEESRCVLPVMRGHPRIFATVDDIQALSIDDHPDLVRQHVAEIVQRLSRVALLLLFCAVVIAAAMSPASAQGARSHTVQQITLDGKPVESATGVAITVLDGSTSATIRRGQTIADGTRIDVPSHITVVVASSGGKSTTTLEPGSSVTFVSTGAGEILQSNRGKTLFNVVPRTLDFYRVQSGETLTASVHGTEFSIDASAENVIFTCTNGEVEITKTGYVVIGRTRAESYVRDVISASGQAVASYRPSLQLAQFNNFGEAEAFYRQQLEAAQQRGDAGTQGAALLNVSAVEISEGRFADARGLAQQALALFRQSGDLQGQAWAMERIGQAERRQEQYNDAIRDLGQARDLFRQVGDLRGEALALRNIGDIERRQGQLGAAFDSLDAAIALYRTLNAKDGIAWCLADIGLVDRDRTRYVDAVSSLQQALALFRQVKDREGEASALERIGLVQVRQHQTLAAQDSYREALAIFEQVGDQSAIDRISAELRAAGNMRQK